MLCYSVHSIPLVFILIILLNSMKVQTGISSYVPTEVKVARVELSTEEIIVLLWDV